jgi:hypothetical protein
MQTQESVASLPFPESRRKSKRLEILTFFVANLRKRVGTGELHARFGTSFRTRVSELRHDPSCPIVINNATDRDDSSVYWAVPRQEAEQQRAVTTESVALAPGSLFGDLSPARRYPD